MKLYVDPGLRACGVALFDGARLVAAGFPESTSVADVRQPAERAEAWLSMLAAVRQWLQVRRPPRTMLTEVFVELPQVYDPAKMSKKKRGTDPNDLIHLACVVATICTEFAPTRTIVMLPHEWKGTIPKEIMHARATGADIRPARPGAPFGAGPVRAEGGPVLTPAELAVLPKLAKSKLHNVLDAVCMGLVMAGRLRTGGLGPAPVGH